jgi:hypothetical protein
MKLTEMIATLRLQVAQVDHWDCGNEMAQHARFTIESGIPTVVETSMP